MGGGVANKIPSFGTYNETLPSGLSGVSSLNNGNSVLNLAGSALGTAFKNPADKTQQLVTLPTTNTSGLPNGISAPSAYNPAAVLSNVAVNNQLENPNTIAPVNVSQNFNADTLRNDIFSGIQSSVGESYLEGQKALDNKMTNTGLFRSGINLENQSNLEGQRMDAIAKGYGDSALQVAGLQQNQAFKQADMDFDVSKYGADIQNAWAEKNTDYLMTAAATDQATINEAAQFNIQIGSAYDELRYEWAKSLLAAQVEREDNALNSATTMRGQDITRELGYLTNDSNLTIAEANAKAQESAANAQLGAYLGSSAINGLF